MVDRQNILKDTPLCFKKSPLPVWLTFNELGIETRCGESTKIGSHHHSSAKRRFTNSFEQSAKRNINRKKYGSAGSVLSRKRLIGHLGCVNAICFSPSGSTLISGGDDRIVKLWDSPQFEDTVQVQPTNLPGEHDSNIFCLDFNGITQTKILSGGNDERVLVHDILDPGRRTQDIFLHEH